MDFQPMSDSEQEIMQIIWKSHGSVRLAYVMDELQKRGRVWKTNTVLTFLTRLAEKGFLRIKKQGRVNDYEAVYTEEHYLSLVTEQFLGRMYGGDAKSLVATLLKRDKLSDSDLDELQQFWKEAKRQRE